MVRPLMARTAIGAAACASAAERANEPAKRRLWSSLAIAGARPCAVTRREFALSRRPIALRWPELSGPLFFAGIREFRFLRRIW